jgi:glycosyltransferase involved in cell wall biosynthesis
MANKKKGKKSKNPHAQKQQQEQSIQKEKEINNPVKAAMPIYPFVSICTPTFNRRPFVSSMIRCFEHQTYPKDKIEWIIIDDGTDKIEDLVKHIPQVKYFSYDEKMTLGRKRNLMHEKSSGDIIVYMDDDDYYPPCRISHAVETLQKNPQALCAGSSEMYIYFKHINKMVQFGPYGPNHATAATFAFRRELLKQTSYNEANAVAEEKHFLKNNTIPFVQLEPKKTILVFSHIHNSFDKRTLIESLEFPNQFMSYSDKKVEEFVKEPELLKFFMEDINELLSSYEPGRPENKQDVLKQIEEIKKSREESKQKFMEEQEKIKQQMVQQGFSPEVKPLMPNSLMLQMKNEKGEIQNVDLHNFIGNYEKRIQEMNEIIQKLIFENGNLKRELEKLKN